MNDDVHPFSIEVLQRFPEIWENVCNGDETLSYLMANHLVAWLVEQARVGLSPEVVKRVVDFHTWCRDQPRGGDASDDIATIEAVGFLEHLFEHDELLPLLGRLLTKEDLRRSREYWVSWVGKDRYEAALRLAK